VAAIERLASRLGLGVMETAQGIVSVVTANMARAIRVISVQRGHDPRDHVLAAFGGAGPLHAARLARELDMTRVIVPRYPGILCAMGLLLTDLRADFAATRLEPLTPAVLGPLAETFARLAAEADAWLAGEGIAPAARRLAFTVDMRYRGQNYELSVALPEGPIGPATLDALAEGFASAHRRRYGFVAEGEAMQIVTARVEAAGVVRKAAFEPRPDAGPDASAALIGRREVFMPEASGFVSCPVYARETLACGNRIAGPAIIEQMDTTTVVLPGMTARVDPFENLVLEDD
jgi:N-methylhydantoinase A